MFLREHHQIALYVACGEISDISLSDNALNVFVKDRTMFTLLHDGKREIERAMSWQGLEVSLNIELVKTETTKEEKDIEILKKIFKDKLTVKGD